MDDALAILVYDCLYAYMTLGDSIVKQVIGVIMGKATSAIAALMSLAWMEDVSRRHIPRQFRLRLGGCRIMDDSVVVAAYRRGDAQSEREADALLSSLQYHPDLVLERTDAPGETIHRYLEGVIDVGDGSRLTCDFFNPNAVSLLHDGVCSKPRFRSWSSYGPASVKRHVILGFFRRMRGYSLTDSLADTQTRAGAQLLLELRHCGFPARWLTRLIAHASDEVLHPAARSALLDALHDCRGCTH